MGELEQQQHTELLLVVAIGEDIVGGQMHRFDGFHDQQAALLHQPKTKASLRFTQVDASSLIGGDHLLIAGQGDTPNWEIPLSLVWLHPDPFASTAALTGYEHWLARGDRI